MEKRQHETHVSLLQKHSAAADIASTLSEDQVPEAFLVMLLIQFSTMIIDRALYLRKAVLGKLIFQVRILYSHVYPSRVFCSCLVDQRTIRVVSCRSSFPGDSGVWDSLLDVLHPACRHGEVKLK